VVNQSAAGTDVLIAAVANKRHKIVQAVLTMTADGTLQFESQGAGALCGPMNVAAMGGFVYESDSNLYQTALGEALRIITTGGAARGAVLVVTE